MNIRSQACAPGPGSGHAGSGESFRGLLRIVAALLLACSAGCSFDYDEGGAAASGRLPTYVLSRAVYTVEREGGRSMFFTADRVEMYEAEHRAVLKNAGFIQRDGDPATAVSGRCDQVEIDTVSQDAVLAGSIVIEVPAERARVEADRLVWDNGGRRLSSGPGELVTIFYRDGTVISGRGFLGDFTLDEYQFLHEAEGILEDEP